MTAENMEMQKLVDTYGKTWHTWQVDRGDPIPLGALRQMLTTTSMRRTPRTKCLASLLLWALWPLREHPCSGILPKYSSVARPANSASSGQHCLACMWHFLLPYMSLHVMLMSNRGLCMDAGMEATMWCLKSRCVTSRICLYWLACQYGVSTFSCVRCCCVACVKYFPLSNDRMLLQCLKEGSRANCALPAGNIAIPTRYLPPHDEGCLCRVCCCCLVRLSAFLSKRIYICSLFPLLLYLVW